MSEHKSVGKNQIAGMNLLEIQEFLVEEKAVLPYNYKLPYMMWYEDNFVGSSEVRDMHPIEEWMYRQLLAKAWVSKNAPYLPNDPEKLKRLSGCKDDELWDEHSKIVLDMFEKTPDEGELFHARQLIDYAIQITKIASNIANGSKGGRPSSKKRTGTLPEPKNNQSVSEIKPNLNQSVITLETENNHMQRQLDLELEQDLKLDLELEPNTPNEEILEQDGQDDMKSEREIQNISLRVFGKTANFYGSSKSTLLSLERSYKGSAVVRAFEDWALGLDEAPNSPGMAFLAVAEDLLGGETTSQKAAKAPEVVSLVRELTYLSDGKVKFADRQKPGLAVLAEEYSQSEILNVFKAWLEDQDLSDPKKMDFAAKNFVECADALCYSARRKKQERAESDSQREANKIRLQEEAEAERAKVEAEKKSEEDLFDPLADVV